MENKEKKMTAIESDVISELKTYLEKRDANTEHIAFQFKDASFASGDTAQSDVLSIGSESMLMTSGAFRQLAEVLNVPVPYAQRIPDDLLDHTMNYFLSSREDNFYAALVEEDIIRSFMPTTNPYVSGLEFFTAIEEAFDSDYDLKYVKVNDVGMSFSILPHEYKNAIDGSDLFGGLSVKFSDSWNQFPSLDTYIWRELCSNGMIDTLKSRKFRIKNSSSGEVINQVQEFARLSLDALPALFEQYQALLTEPVTNYVRMIARLCSDYRLANKVKERILFWAEQDVFLETISDRSIKNMHDIVNLFTFAGSHDLELTDDVREMLLAIGGSLTMSHADRCGSCGNSI
jgi:hypothetical protein